METALYDMVPWGNVVDERSEQVDSPVFPPLSVGKQGVTPQLENIAKAKDKSNRKIVRKGDLVINQRSDRRGASGLSELDGTVSVVYSVMKPKTDVLDPLFAHHLLRSTWFQEEFFRFGTGIVADLWSTRFERMRQIRVPLPPIDTQRAIADYLDRETSEIDAMLDKLDGLGRLLEERFRQQLVVAIRGTDAPLVSLGAVSDIALGKMIQPNRKNQTDVYAPYLRAAHIQPGGRLDFDVTDQKMWFVPDELARLNLRRGDVVVVEGGAGFGRPAYLDQDLEGWGFQNSINRVRPFPEKVLGKFIYYAMHLALVSGEIELEVSTATIPHFTAEKVARFRIPLPPLDEQERIVQHLDETTARIDAMLAKTQQLKDLLAERRSALITAAVTGQIEV